MGKIIALGSMNSGKTTYLIGMYQAMGSVIEKFSLIIKDDKEDFHLNTMWEKMIEEGMPPDPSNRLEVFNFSLIHEFKPICDVDWIEYGVDFSPYESQRFQDDMKNTDCLLLFIDGGIFHIPDAQNVDDYEQKLHSRLIFNQSIKRSLSALVKVTSAGIRLPPIAIVVTKADLIDVQYQDVINSALYKRFAAIFNAPDRLVLKVAVSLGGSIEPRFKPDLFCVEQPIVFALITILLNHIKEAHILIKKNEDFIRNHFFGITKAKSHIELLKLRMADMVHSCRRLIDTVSVQKVVYIGGAEKNFRNYFNARLEAY